MVWWRWVCIALTLWAVALLNPTSALTQCDYEKIVEEIESVIAGHEDNIGAFIRLAWHDSGTYDQFDGTGGTHACQRFRPSGEYDDEANAGLHITVDCLYAVHTRNADKIAMADLWALAGLVAISHGGPDPKEVFHWGRKDCKNHESGRPGRLPGANFGTVIATLQHLKTVFRRLGVDERGLVALSGGHTCGRAHKDFSGFHGPWVATSKEFNNQYYVDLLKKPWFTHRLEDTNQVQLRSGLGDEMMMLQSDVAILLEDEMFYIALEYANDESLFFKHFAFYFNLLQENSHKLLYHITSCHCNLIEGSDCGSDDCGSWAADGDGVREGNTLTITVPDSHVWKWVYDVATQEYSLDGLSGQVESLEYYQRFSGFAYDSSESKVGAGISLQDAMKNPLLTIRVLGDQFVIGSGDSLWFYFEPKVWYSIFVWFNWEYRTADVSIRAKGQGDAQTMRDIPFESPYAPSDDEELAFMNFFNGNTYTTIEYSDLCISGEAVPSPPVNKSHTFPPADRPIFGPPPPPRRSGFCRPRTKDGVHLCDWRPPTRGLVTEIFLGDTVIWNFVFGPHTITSDECDPEDPPTGGCIIPPFNSGRLPTGEAAYNFTFNERPSNGEGFGYHCDVHGASLMNGMIVVLDEDPPIGDVYPIDGNRVPGWKFIFSNTYDNLCVKADDELEFLYDQFRDVWRFDDVDDYERCDFSSATLMADSSQGGMDFRTDERTGRPFRYKIESAWKGHYFGIASKSEAHCLGGTRFLVYVQDGDSDKDCSEVFDDRRSWLPQEGENKQPHNPSSGGSDFDGITHQVIWKVGAAIDLSIEAGDRVQFIWSDEAEHSVTAYGCDQFSKCWNEPGDSGLLPAHSSYFYIFQHNGYFSFWCLAHPGAMHGVIRVTGQVTDDTGEVDPTGEVVTPTGAFCRERDASGVHLCDWLPPPAGSGLVTNLITEIFLGDTIVWNFIDGPHTVTGSRNCAFSGPCDTPPGNSEILPTGSAAYSFTFDERPVATEGDPEAAEGWSYHCNVHGIEAMKGLVVILDGEAPTDQQEVITEATCQPRDENGIHVCNWLPPLEGFVTSLRTEILLGDTVIWNFIEGPHTVTGTGCAFSGPCDTPPGNSDILPTGQEAYSFTFTSRPETGEGWTYHCNVHGENLMNGIVVIVDDESNLLAARDGGSDQSSQDPHSGGQQEVKSLISEELSEIMESRKSRIVFFVAVGFSSFMLLFAIGVICYKRVKKGNYEKIPTVANFDVAA